MLATASGNSEVELKVGKQELRRAVSCEVDTCLYSAL